MLNKEEGKVKPELTIKNFSELNIILYQDRVYHPKELLILNF